jgi:hypothetical protein
MNQWKSALCVLVFSCNTQVPPKQDSTQQTSKSQTTPTSVASVSKPTEPTTTRRRLHIQRAEASSFLNQKKNLIWDRYHPNYALDGDPNSAWNEGAETSGAGEWIRLPITKQEGLTALTLRFLNGYQKSESLFQSNTRAKTIQVTLLPGRETKTFTLEDKMGWQEIVLADLKAPTVEAIELTIVDVYEGKKYKDLCLSEIEVFATSASKEEPEAEAAKQAELLAWVKGQQDALTLLKSEGILPWYIVEPLEDFPGFSPEATAFLEARKETPPMSTVRLISSKKETITPDAFAPPCEDLSALDLYFDDEGDPHDDYPEHPENIDVYVPSEEYFSSACFDSFSLFTSVGVSVKEKKETAKCDIEIYAPIENITAGGLIRELKIDICSEYVEHRMVGRPGAGEYDKREVTSTATQSLLFDEAGRLRALIGKNETIWFDWTKQNGTWILSGALRDNPPARLVPALNEGTTLPASVPASVPTSNAASAPASAPTSLP